MTATSFADGSVDLHQLDSDAGVVEKFSSDSCACVVRFSPFLPGLLAMACENGSVILRDLERAQQSSLSPTTTHRAAITGLEFASQSRALMATCGLDKRVLLFDVMQRSVVRELPSIYPFAALSFRFDAHLLAIGTMSGSVMVFDLRGGDAPVSQSPTHAPFPCTSVVFYPREVGSRFSYLSVTASNRA
jgi:WD40 repeat protein